MPARPCALCEEIIPEGAPIRTLWGSDDVVCLGCAQALDRVPNWPPPEGSESDSPERRRCGWCGEALTPDDAGVDHVGCTLTRPGWPMCRFCGRPVRAREAVSGSNGDWPLHAECAKPL
jgi:hypothetical protein